MGAGLSLPRDPSRSRISGGGGSCTSSSSYRRRVVMPFEEAHKDDIVDGGALICMDDRRLARDTSIATIEEPHSNNNSTLNGAAGNSPPSSSYKKPYDVRMVAAMVKARQLAPFYDGLADQLPKPPTAKKEEENGENADEKATSTTLANEKTPSTAALQTAPITGEQLSTETPPPSSPVQAGQTRHKPRRFRPKKFFIRLFVPSYLKSSFTSAQPNASPNSKQPVTDNSCPEIDTLWLKHKWLIECPICFLKYPRNINWTSCCRHAICTFCFLHLRQPPSGREITCPFCNAGAFSVRYWAPLAILELQRWLKEKERSDTASSTNSNGNNCSKHSLVSTVSSSNSSSSSTVSNNPIEAHLGHVAGNNNGPSPIEVYGTIVRCSQVRLRPMLPPLPPSNFPASRASSPRRPTRLLLDNDDGGNQQAPLSAAASGNPFHRRFES